jgi:hypothetical protein
MFSALHVPFTACSLSTRVAINDSALQRELKHAISIARTTFPYYVPRHVTTATGSLAIGSEPFS